MLRDRALKWTFLGPARGVAKNRRIRRLVAPPERDAVE
jgi:hypothetical protein